jgi:hypothetical protein
MRSQRGRRLTVAGNAPILVGRMKSDGRAVAPDGETGSDKPASPPDPRRSYAAPLALSVGVWLLVGASTLALAGRYVDLSWIAFLAVVLPQGLVRLGARSRSRPAEPWLRTTALAGTVVAVWSVATVRPTRPAEALGVIGGTLCLLAIYLAARLSAFQHLRRSRRSRPLARAIGLALVIAYWAAAALLWQRSFELSLWWWEGLYRELLPELTMGALGAFFVVRDFLLYRRLQAWRRNRRPLAVRLGVPTAKSLFALLDAAEGRAGAERLAGGAATAAAAAVGSLHDLAMRAHAAADRPLDREESRAAIAAEVRRVDDEEIAFIRDDLERSLLELAADRIAAVCRGEPAAATADTLDEAKESWEPTEASPLPASREEPETLEARQMPDWPAVARRAAPRIFISYRRDDSGDIAGRIYDRLIGELGRKAVFKDVDSIPLGADFPRVIAESLRQCSAVLVVVGPGWLSERLERPDDWVRIEIETALALGVRLIPLLVGGASIPPPAALPEPLRPLAQRNGMAVRRDPDFHHDMDRLIRTLAD